MSKNYETESWVSLHYPERLQQCSNSEEYVVLDKVMFHLVACRQLPGQSKRVRREMWLNGGQWIWHPLWICWFWKLTGEGPESQNTQVQRWQMFYLIVLLQKTQVTWLCYSVVRSALIIAIWCVSPLTVHRFSVESAVWRRDMSAPLLSRPLVS